MEHPDNFDLHPHSAGGGDREDPRQESAPRSKSAESPSALPRLALKAQEIPLDHPDSCNLFQSGPDRPFLATPAAIDTFGVETILRCLAELQVKAVLHSGLDYLQVFIADDGRKLWFIEDGPSGAITALLPSDY